MPMTVPPSSRISVLDLLDRHLPPVSCQQQALGRSAAGDRVAAAQRARPARNGHAQHLGQVVAHGLVGLPARQGLGGAAHEADTPFGVRGDHRLPDAAQRGGEPALALPQAAFHLVPVERHLDHDVQLALVEGLEKVAVRLGDACPLERRGIRVRGEIDDRDVQNLPDVLRRLDAVHVAAQVDVHQDEVGTERARTLDRVPAAADRRGDGVPQPLKGRSDVERDCGLVLDHQDARRAGSHEPEKRMRNSVPPSERSSIVPPSCSVSAQTSCIPRVSVARKSTSFGNPTPSSATRRR